jgi:hypothetical protein
MEVVTYEHNALHSVPASVPSLSWCRRSSVSNHRDYRFNTGAKVRMPFGCFLDVTKALVWEI